MHQRVENERHVKNHLMYSIFVELLLENKKAAEYTTLHDLRRSN